MSGVSRFILNFTSLRCCLTGLFSVFSSFPSYNTYSEYSEVYEYNEQGKIMDKAGIYTEKVMCLIVKKEPKLRAERAVTSEQLFALASCAIVILCETNENKCCFTRTESFLDYLICFHLFSVLMLMLMLMHSMYPRANLVTKLRRLRHEGCFQ